MRPQKLTPRADHRRQENQRTQDSPSLAEKFAGLKSLTVEVALFNGDGIPKNGQLKCTFNPDHAKSVIRFDCQNSECIRGDFDLSDAVAQAVAERSATATGEVCCPGWLSKTTIDKIRCRNILRYKLSLGY